MDIVTKSLNRCELITITGRIDASNSKDLGQVLQELLNVNRYNLIVALKGVTYISSSGLSELIDAQKRCKQLNRGELVLAETPQRIKEVLDLAGLTPLFKRYETIVEAVGSF